MISKKVLLFDIDKTLLDTEKTSEIHNQEVLKILKTNDLDMIREVKLEYRATLSNEREYVPEDYLKLLVDRFKSSQLKELIDVYYKPKYTYAYESAVYPEVKGVLDIVKNKFELGIYSEGTTKFQNHKFKSMNLLGYFNKDLIFIVPAKDTQETLDKIPKNAIIVDDKETICDFLHKNNIDCIWLNKKDDRKSDDYKTIHSLLQLPDIIN